MELDTKLHTNINGEYLSVSIPTLPFGHLKIHQKNLTKIGHVVWDCSRVLAYYFLSDDFKTKMASKNMHYDKWSLLNVIEIGCGPGLAGIQMASLGFNVLLTDFCDVLTLTKLNAKENEALIGDRVNFAEMDWSQHDICSEFVNKDIILSSDCLYEESCIHPLASILKRLAHPNSIIIFAFEDRDEEMQSTFFKIMADSFEWVEVPFKNQHADYQRSFIYILFMHLKTNE